MEVVPGKIWELNQLLMNPDDLFLSKFIWSFLQYISIDYYILRIKQINKQLFTLTSYNVNEGQDSP